MQQFSGNPSSGSQVTVTLDPGTGKPVANPDELGTHKGQTIFWYCPEYDIIVHFVGQSPIYPRALKCDKGVGTPALVVGDASNYPYFITLIKGPNDVRTSDPYVVVT